MDNLIDKKKVRKKLRKLISNPRGVVKELTPVDFLVVVIIVGVLVVCFVYFSRKKATIYIHTVNEFQEFREDPMPPFYWLSNSIRKGDVVYGVGGEKVAEVVSIDNTEWGGQRRFSRLKLKIAKALYDKRTRQYRIGDTSLQVGNKLVLDIGTTHYEGVVAYVGETLDPPADQYKYLKLTIKVPEIQPWLAVTYDESFVVKNSEGKEILKIIESEIVPTERSVDTEDGRIVRSKDPYYKDAIIDVLVWVRCQENICYFNEFRPVKVGEYIWTQSEKSIIPGGARIIDIEEVDN